jgi:hypothetical protein
MRARSTRVTRATRPTGLGSCMCKMRQLEHSANMFQLEHTGGLQLMYNGFGWDFVLNVPVGTFGKHQKLSA